jgi:hypothetical protein
MGHQCSRVVSLFTLARDGASVSYVSRVVSLFTLARDGASVSYVSRVVSLFTLARDGGIRVLSTHSSIF